LKVNGVTALVITAAKLGPEQKLFNQLLTKIETASASLAELNRLADAHRPDRVAKVTPLVKKNQFLDEKLVLFLASRLQYPKGLSKNQQENIAHIAVQVGQSVLDSGFGSAELEAEVDRLCEEYAAHDEDDDLDGDDDSAQGMRGLQGMIADMLGSDFEGAEGLDSPEAVMQAAMKKRQAEYEAWSQAQEARRANRKKSNKEKLAEQEILDADSALRLIYRKLASALHPDREPDEIERIRKTQLMAQVNAANDNKDLLTLLRLQLEIEQIHPEAIAAMADDKLRSYNRVLKEQFKTIQHELQQLMHRVRHEFNLSYGAINEKSLQSALRLDLLGLQQQADLRQSEFNYIQHDKNLKAWVKEHFKRMNDSAGWDSF
jgi:phage gp37-like protein